METTMSLEEKIRKAEEIYYRRNKQEIQNKEFLPTTKQVKKNVCIVKKMVKKIIICVVMYVVCYYIINNNYIFSRDFTQKVKEILEQDINFVQLYSIFCEKINNIKQEDENKIEEIIKENEVKEEEIEIQNNDENIGGAENLVLPEETNEVVELSQMEQDVNYIKSTISFIKPVNGSISSMFGIRNPTTPTVPKNHTGTDIAAVIGTKIFSSTEGNVIDVSSEGDYGNHIKIQVNDVIILYAHCNKIYVKEGDIIEQGQEIAEVGSTGNTTGPHLHFEIRLSNRYINPKHVIEF